MGMQSSFVFPICIMASTMMVTEDISSCEDMEPMDSVIAVHIVFLSIRFVQDYRKLGVLTWDLIAG